ncbi:aspartic peptidase domain-containing protein [Xylariales sp. PMI_506]|nr:aspartic peptidase domain-containing protein [Xylariales sp. PMI_506]
MKTSTALVFAFELATSLATHNVLPISIYKPAHPAPLLHRRATSTYTGTLNNNLTGQAYYADVSVGTPPQNLTLVIDTGSSDVWLLASDSTLCTSTRNQQVYGYCSPTYDSSSSSTYKLVLQNGFSISYADSSGAKGDYITDDFSFAGATIESLQMGLADQATIPIGIMGIGLDTNEAASKEYPNLMDEFLSQGLIASKAYSLYLDDYSSSTGNILFGGIDTEKFVGDLTALPIQPDSQSNTYTSFTVALSSISLTNGGSSSSVSSEALPVVLDSGTTLTYLPVDIISTIYDTLNVYDDENESGFVYIDCSYSTKNITFDYQFGGGNGPVVKVPISEVVFDTVKLYESEGLQLPRNLPFDDPCIFGMMASQGIYLLGDTFLRSAYVVYDLSNLEIAVAQANFGSTGSNVVAISAGDSQIPSVTGVASEVSVTQTATGLPGEGGGNAVPTVTVTASSTATTSKSAAGGRNTPLLRWDAIVVAAVTFLGMIGGGILVVV